MANPDFGVLNEKESLVPFGVLEMIIAKQKWGIKEKVTLNVSRFCFFFKRF